MLAKDFDKATVPDMGFTPPSGDIYLLKALVFSPLPEKESVAKARQNKIILLYNVVPTL